MSLVEVNGVGLHVQELEGGADTGAPPLVMLHGLLVDNMASWYFTAAPALARGGRVILFDLRGHGRSERAASGYDSATLVADLEALLEQRGIGRVDLVGHSFGGIVALRFALANPDRVRRLALVEAPLPPSDIDELRQLAGKSPAELLESMPQGMRSGILGGRRRARRALDSLGFLLGESTLVADLLAEPDIPDATLGGLETETLCVFGASSACLPVGARLARALPNARLAELDGGHFLPLDAPHELTSALVGFLRD